MKRNNGLRLFSGFAGHGGIDKAFLEVFRNGRIVGYSEIDPHCSKCNKDTKHKLLNHFESECIECGHIKKQWASAVYQYHYGGKNFGDIRLIRPERLPDFDIFSFGWPCQDNSIAGKRKGQKEDTRSGLLSYAVKILRIKKPALFFAENVKGLFSVNSGIDFIETIRLLTYLRESLPQYDIQMQLLNTRTVLPQNRERLFFIGTLRSKSTPEIFPITESDYKYGKETQELEAKENIIAGTINLKNNSPNWSFDNGSTLIVHNLQKQSRAGGRKGHREDNTAFSVASVMMQGVELKQIGNVGNGNSEATRVYNLAGISKTIKFGGGQEAKTGLYLVTTTGQGGKLQKRDLDNVPPLRAKDRADIRIVSDKKHHQDELNDCEGVSKCLVGGSNRNAQHYTKTILSDSNIRRLTPLECCKLQGYNNVFEQDVDQCYTKFALDAEGNTIEVPETHQYKMIGNGVTSDLVKVIFNKLKRSFDGN